MTDLILRIFVRDHKNTEDPAVRDKCGRVAGAVGIVTNFLLFLMKIIVGTVFHSVSVTADAVNNLTDSGSSVVTLIGFKMASKPADEKHPFGHARIEYLSGVIVSFIVEKDGSVSNILVLQSPDKLLADEARRVIASSPAGAWTPGEQRGEKVRVKYTLPVDFYLQGSGDKLSERPEKPQGSLDGILVVGYGATSK
mgnify:CR=1 FL=1